ncbi:UNVERIFIED_CONTAM: hypothetical protein PYX00_001808 [Menopon gallinae]|uniref:Uncharacterized protein n=1 Tax=Menopon gallinae TaxID=328185 RepID=A0AAW2IFZ3_9NEOP
MSIVLRQSLYVIPRSFSYKKCCKYENLLQMQNFSTRDRPVLLPDVKLQFYNYMNKKVEEILNWYEQFSGLNEVRLAQNKVIEAGEKLAKMQDERKDASRCLMEIQKKIKEIHSELDNTKRGDDRYVTLITEEHKLLKEEQDRQVKFREAENAEREQFHILTNAVKNSHEKERTQAEKTKYWSIIGSVVGTILGIIGTSINNHIKMAELKTLIHESSGKELKKKLEEYLKTNESIKEETLKYKIVGAKSAEGLLVKIDELREDNVRLKSWIITACVLCIVVQIVSKILSE